MSDTNGRIDYSRLVRDIDFGNTFEGTTFEQYTDTENGVGSILGGWLGAMLGRLVGMALGRVAQELVVDELFGTTNETEEANGMEGHEGGESEGEDETTDGEEGTTNEDGSSAPQD